MSLKSQITKSSVSKLYHEKEEFQPYNSIPGKTEEVQTFSFETGDDEKYELIEGGHTFHSEVADASHTISTWVINNCSIRRKRRRVKVW